MKIHPSNFRIHGFTSSVPVGELARCRLPVIADIGSGLLAPDPLLPDEPDVAQRPGRRRRPSSPAAATSCSAARRPG